MKEPAMNTKPQVIEHDSRAVATQAVPAAALTPMDMIDRAASSGASVEVIGKLMELQERWERNQAKKAFDEAIALAKAELKPIERNALGQNSKRYADFSAVAMAVDPIISKYGLSYRHRSTQTDRINITCILSHKLGHSEETTLGSLPDKTGNKNDIQAIGSAVQYLMRYTLMLGLGLSVARDDDGKKADDSGPVSDKQAETIRDLLTATKSDLDRFLKWSGAPSISDIPASKFNDAIAMLNAKKNKVQS